jgi:hypothetical protein
MPLITGVARAATHDVAVKNLFKSTLACLPEEMGDRAEGSPAQGCGSGRWLEDVTMLLTCYQHSDEATMLKVMQSPVKLVSRQAASALELRERNR